MLSAEHKKLPIEAHKELDGADVDAILILANNLQTDLKRYNVYDAYGSELEIIKGLNNGFESEVTFTIINKKRVIYSPTGPVNRDYDDVRRVADAANAAVQKAVGLGSKRPLLINCVKHTFDLADQVALLAALDAAHIPLEIREAHNKHDLLKIEKLFYWQGQESDENTHKLVDRVNAIELGRIVTRDIGGSDPERMAPPRVLEYVQHVFKGTQSIQIQVVEGQKHFERDYPLFAAVNRAADAVPRHQGRIIKLLYNPSNDAKIDTTLFLIGKGITYDTGGADVKHGGHMAGMHRDKCGAAFVAGFFKTLELLKPKGIKVYGTLCLTRNNIGEECYVADEIITARSKKRVRVGNTDAEGRMAMADALCEAKEIAVNEINPQLFTIATLTGHVIRAYGENYTGILSNGPARGQKIDYKLQESGEVTGDPYEISTIRRDDYKTVTGKSEYEDLLQSTNNPSSAEPRGHQFPGAFLILASGLEKHGNNAAEKKIPYTHVDIAGSSGPFPGKPTGAPLPSFTHQYILPRL